jgi:membrane protease YdiL (CAAX protease family)
MRPFLLLCAVILGCLAAGSMLAYPAYLLVHPLNPDWPFHRIANRVSLLLLLISLIWLLKYLRVNNREGLGFTLDRRTFLRHAATALGIGVLMMLPVIGALWALDIRVVDPDFIFTPAALGALLLKGLIGGLVVALIEETLLRGAMHSAIERQSGRIAAVLLTAFVYAALHFIGKAKVPHEEVEWLSGLILIRGALSAFSDPLALIDSFLALFAVGVLLGLVRIRTGSIAACIGLHAGWVWVITTTREITVRNPDAPLSFLAGSYDGVVGYLVFAWTLLIILLFWHSFTGSRETR